MPTDRETRIAVLHFDNARVRGGAEEHILTLLKGLDRARFRPLLAVHPELLSLMQADLPPDVEIIPTVLEGVRDIGGALAFKRALLRHRVDIVHSHLFQASRLASPIARMAGVPVTVETPHIRELWRNGWITGSFVLDRFVGRFVAAYIAVSQANADYLINEKGLPRHKVRVVRNGIPIDRFDPRRIAPSKLRQSAGLEDDAPVVLVLARLEPQKGHSVLLDAWRIVTEKFPQARLVCVGTGRLREELDARTRELNLEASVRFVGFQSNVPDWLALSSFTVLPSFYEGLPLVAIESLASGRSMVATGIDGTSEVIIDGHTGLLVPPGRSDLLATSISRLLENPELARQLGQAGRRLVERQFTDSRQIAETEAIYFEVLRSRQYLRETHRLGDSRATAGDRAW